MLASHAMAAAAVPCHAALLAVGLVCRRACLFGAVHLPSRREWFCRGCWSRSLPGPPPPLSRCPCPSHRRPPWASRQSRRRPRRRATPTGTASAKYSMVSPLSPYHPPDPPRPCRQASGTCPCARRLANCNRHMQQPLNHHHFVVLPRTRGANNLRRRNQTPARHAPHVTHLSLPQAAACPSSTTT